MFSLVVAVIAVSAMGIGFSMIGESGSIDRPDTGQAPNITTTPGGFGQATTNQSADPVTYRVTATSASAVNRTELRRYGDVGTQATNHVEVTLTRANASRVANLTWVESLRPAQQGVPADDASTNHSTVDTSTAQSALPTGDDVKIGVIDNEFDTSNSIITDQVAADYSFRDSPGDPYHGTSVAEIVATIAPNSSLYVASIASGTDTEAAISTLTEDDVDIIVMSLAWLADDDGDHFLTDDVNTARDQGVLFVNSAGNYAQVHWEGEFQSADGDQIHEWAGSDERNCIPNCETTLSGDVVIRLDWEDDGDGSQYQLALYNPETDEIIETSETSFGGDHSILATNIRSQPIDLVVANIEGPADDKIELTVFGGPRSIQYNVPSSSLTPPADVPSVLTVAAYEPDRNRIAPYSSQGPTDTGQRGVDITGYTNLQISSGIFAGTSAAAPYIGGVAALVQAASSEDLSPDELEAALTETAIDRGPAGSDPIWGAGLVNGSAAVASVQPENDRFEPNDERETATNIGPGSYDALQIVRGDRDYFAVELEANTSLTATAAFSHQTGDLELGIYGPNGELQAASTSTTDNETVRLDRATTAGTYYLVVIGATNDTVAPYSLAVETEQQTPVSTASVQLANQTTAGASVNVGNATLPDGGFVTIHDGSLLDGATFDSVHGTSPYLSAGSHTNISVSLTEPYDTNGTIIAILYRDTNGNEAYDFVSSKGASDGPYTTTDGEIVLDAATLTVEAQVAIDGLETAGPVAPGETVSVTYEYMNLGTDAAAAGRIELDTPAGVKAVAIDGNGTSGLGATPQSVLYGFNGPIASGETKATTVTFRVGNETDPGDVRVTATAFIEGTEQTASHSTTVAVADDVVAQFDENDDGTIGPAEAQAAIVALNNGEISPRAAQQIIGALNAS